MPRLCSLMRDTPLHNCCLYSAPRARLGEQDLSTFYFPIFHIHNVFFEVSHDPVSLEKGRKVLR